MKEKCYDDIIYLTPPKPWTKTPMTMEERAAQFGAFAAVTGHKEELQEVQREVGVWKEIEGYQIDCNNKVIRELQYQLEKINHMVQELPQVTITYFVPDVKKKGGCYVTELAKVIKINEYEKTIYLDSGRKIAMGYIYEIRS